MIRWRMLRAIYFREGLDILRDYRTLVFLLVIPILLSFALGTFLIRETRRVIQTEAFRTVTIVANAETESRYLAMAHEAFLRGGGVADWIRFQHHPLTRILLPSGININELGAPQAVLHDPIAYRDWAAGLAEKGRAAVTTAVNSGGAGDRTATPANLFAANSTASTEVTRLITDFYQSTVKRVGLVRFVPPELLPPASADADSSSTVPVALQGHPDAARVLAAISRREADGWLRINGTPAEVKDDQVGWMEFAFFTDGRQIGSREARQRLLGLASQFEDVIVAGRIRDAGLSVELLDPVRAPEESTELATPAQNARFVFAIAVPYIILLSTILGTSFPSIEMGAGEKERGTLETLLLSPVHRLEVALGKYLMLVTSGLTAVAVVGVAAASGVAFFSSSLGAALPFNPGLRELGIILLLAFPVVSTFAAIFLAASVYARSFKEGQGYLSTFTVLLMFPPMYAMLPWAKLTFATAAVPLVNVGLLSRELLGSQGSVEPLHVATTLLSSILFAALCIGACMWMFNRESVLSRS
jgi:ABC-type Na+ efflux pump permease subunit